MSLGASGTVVQGNEISRNGGSGGVVSGPTTVGNTILSNSIYGNAGGGISLVQEANRRQVAHKLTSARLARRRIAITGTIAGWRGDVYRIKFFASLPGDATAARNAQGRMLIGYRDVQLTGSIATIHASFATAGIPVKHWNTATATGLVNKASADTSQIAGGIRAR